MRACSSVAMQDAKYCDQTRVAVKVVVVKRRKMCGRARV